MPYMEFTLPGPNGDPTHSDLRALLVKERGKLDRQTRNTRHANYRKTFKIQEQPEFVRVPGGIQIRQGYSFIG